jgi:hypothetical protein
MNFFYMGLKVKQKYVILRNFELQGFEFTRFYCVSFEIVSDNNILLCTQEEALPPSQVL